MEGPTYTNESIICCDKSMHLVKDRSAVCGRCGIYYRRVFVCSVCKKEMTLIQVSSHWEKDEWGVG